MAICWLLFCSVNSLRDADLNPRFSVRTFAPGWGASVMGTGVLSTIFWAWSTHGFHTEITGPLSIAFFWLSCVVAIPVLGVIAARWLAFPRAVFADVNHPVKGGMSATFPGGILVMAIATGRVGQDVLGRYLALNVAAVLTVVGAVLALWVGFVFLTRFLGAGDTPKGMMTGVWFIPPVVTVLVPTALIPMIETKFAFARELLWVAWTLLGIGTFLFVVVATALVHRELTEPPAPAKLAPTLMIGAGPAGVVALNLLTLAQASVEAVESPREIAFVAVPVSMMFWGFGLWWLTAAMVIIVRAYGRLPFGLSWWAFTFPVGAWIVSGVYLAAITGAVFIQVFNVLGVLALLLVWATTAVRTLRGVIAGTVWQD